MRIIECEQGSVDWWLARKGIPTASQFDRILTPKTGKYSASAEEYICELIADGMMGGPPQGIEGYTSKAMQDGIDTEPEARRWYAFERDAHVQQVGFCLTDDGRFGCSPDGLVGDDGGLELKCPMLKTHIKYLSAGTLPAEYKCQVHGSLIVTERAWWDFVSYAPNLPPLLVRVEPDTFTEQLRAAMETFWTQLEHAKALIETKRSADEPEIVSRDLTTDIVDSDDLPF